ncbi:hypothetical protein SAMN05216359_105293 [Roseateles sp. YR242]|uniref:hypothetical protein n=1 Tax=Roseateles sp. YR242 TaxID=1855305 RepID=UPI0008B41C97|nr:hypothetical protein [Roseateles sp. YR242]SEL12728.1 hypothetical protein SAMN05216359_105293 [Roseateles sp. YR242]
MAETEKEQRTRLAAGLLGCQPAQVQHQVRAMDQVQRQNLTDAVDWVADYESNEREAA